MNHILSIDTPPWMAKEILNSCFNLCEDFSIRKPIVEGGLKCKTVKATYMGKPGRPFFIMTGFSERPVCGYGLTNVPVITGDGDRYDCMDCVDKLVAYLCSSNVE